MHFSSSIGYMSKKTKIDQEKAELWGAEDLCIFCALYCNTTFAFFKLYMIHVKKSMIDQEKAELWGVGCQSPPDN